MSVFSDNFDSIVAPSLMSTFGSSFSMSTGVETQSIVGVLSGNTADQVDESGFIVERDNAEIVLRTGDVVIPVEVGTVFSRTIGEHVVRWMVYAEGSAAAVRYRDEHSRLFLAVRVKRMGEDIVAG